MHIEQNYSYLIIREGLWSFENYIFCIKSLLFLISYLCAYNLCQKLRDGQELTSTELEKLDEYKSIARASLDLPSFTCCL